VDLCIFICRNIFNAGIVSIGGCRFVFVRSRISFALVVFRCRGWRNFILL